LDFIRHASTLTPPHRDQLAGDDIELPGGFLDSLVRVGGFYGAQRLCLGGGARDSGGGCGAEGRFGMAPASVWRSGSRH